MSLARKIAWWSLLGMVFVVPVAMSNATWLSRIGFPISLPFTLRPVRHHEGVLPARAHVGRTRRMVVGSYRRAGRCGAPGRLAHPGVPRVGHAHHDHVDPSCDRVLRQVPPIRGSGSRSRLRRVTSSSCRSSTGLRGQAARAVGLLLELGRAGYGVLQRDGLDPVQWGQLPFEFSPSVLHVRQPRPSGRLSRVLAAIALALALSEAHDGLAAHLLGRSSA